MIFSLCGLPFFLPSHPHTYTQIYRSVIKTSRLFCKSTVNSQLKPTESDLLNLTVLNWAMLPAMETNRNWPKYLSLVEGSYHPCAMHCSLLWQWDQKLWGKARGPCKAVLLSGCHADFLSGNSLLSSVSWNHLQTPAVNESFTFSHKKQMHLDTRFLTAFSGIHHNAFGEKKQIQLGFCHASLSKVFVLQAFPPSAIAPPPFPFMQSERFSTLVNFYYWHFTLGWQFSN